MLILCRKVNESIVIDGRIVVKIVRVDGEVVKIGIEAPASVPVHRHEVYLEIQKNNREALTAGIPVVPKLSPKSVVPPGTKEPPVKASPAAQHAVNNP